LQLLASGLAVARLGMATARDLRRLALALEGTSEAPHFDRAAFKVATIYVTLAADGKTANFKFSAEEQELRCSLQPRAFAPVAGGWGAMGYTTGTLAALSVGELEDALRTAWGQAQRKPRKRAAKRGKG